MSWHGRVTSCSNFSCIRCSHVCLRCLQSYLEYQTSLDFSCVCNYHSHYSQSWGSRLNCLPAFGPSSFSCCPRDRASLLWMRRFIDVPQSQRLIRAKYCVRAVVASWWLQQQYTTVQALTPSLWGDGSTLTGTTTFFKSQPESFYRDIKQFYMYSPFVMKKSSAGSFNMNAWSGLRY